MMESSKPLQAREKTEATTPAEQIKPGMVFTPAVDIFETDREITMLADIPGVRSKELDIDLHDNVLTIDGEVAPPEGENEVDILREYRTGRYYRQFTLSQVIDQSKIDAKLKDGVLRLTLPKVKAATPRKITVKVA
jgi:HSP20 family molecular chaperone IbpA